ncbi:hypothetical protein [Microbispora sp. KK1-11]|uniref:hypothetical protein n=1 Tax=Microbispora sp. KK1-11 TaxID=2053005 RepID=UPI00163C148E|nr:hypothetical protein [Microbispora sp. KK1-11]
MSNAAFWISVAWLSLAGLVLIAWNRIRRRDKNRPGPASPLDHHWDTLPREHRGGQE